MKKITIKWLQKHKACCSYEDMQEAEKIGDLNKIINALIKNERFFDANWLISRYMTKIQCIEYAIFAAEQVLYLFEDTFPEDNRPRNAIKAAKKYLNTSIKENAAANVAANAADNAANAAYANAAYAAAYAAYAATYAAAYAANAAAYAVDAAYANVAYAADNADNADNANANVVKLKIKILKKGIYILEQEGK